MQSYCKATDHFFRHLAAKGVQLSAVGMTDIDDAMAAEHERGAWSRRTRHDFAQRLRAFFLFAEMRGWCRAGLAAGIVAPRFMADEDMPKGLPREDVVRLLASVTGERACALEREDAVGNRGQTPGVWAGRCSQGVGIEAEIPA